MPPRTPASTLGSYNAPEDAASDDLIKAIQAHQSSAARAQLENQQRVVVHAEALAREYRRAVRDVLDRETSAREEAVAKYQDDEDGLVSALRGAERELLALLQVEASTAELAAAAVQSEVEGLYDAGGSAAEGMRAVQQEEAKSVDAALEGIWPRNEGDIEEGERDSSRSHD
ncbi:hypothetical protein JCM1840_005202 [Sporobolomyces johnsonii]